MEFSLSFLSCLDVGFNIYINIRKEVTISFQAAQEKRVLK